MWKHYCGVLLLWGADTLQDFCQREGCHAGPVQRTANKERKLQVRLRVLLGNMWGVFWYQRKSSWPCIIFFSLFRYYFKKVSDEFDCGVVFEEVREDDAILPIFEEKIIGKVEKVD